MKKTYQAPTLATLQLSAEANMMASLSVVGKDDKKVTDESEVYSNAGGWNSDSWTDTED